MTRKTSHQEATNKMLKLKLEPLEEYPGRAKPWRCKCLRCGNVVTPMYAGIQNGSKGCKYCANRVAISESQAREIFANANLEPLTRYPGSRRGWKSKCTKCKKISTPRVDTVKNRDAKCRFCSAKERGLKGRLSQEEAHKMAMRAKLKPLEPYETSQKKWKCECLRCGAIVYPMATSLQGGQGGCKSCGYLETKRKQLLPEKEAIAFFKSRGFTPLVPYPGANRPWKSKCKKCGEITSPYYNRVLSGTGCGVCAGKIVVPSKAIQIMRDADLEPLEPYPGGKKSWKSKCKRCKKLVSPKYSDIRNGDGGCKYCGGHYVEPEAALQFMLTKGVTPQEPYIHNGKKWHCICNACGRNVYPTWNTVQQGRSACAYCARRMVEPNEAIARMRERGAEPQIPYPGARERWKCICKKCGREIYPDYSSVVNEGNNPCGYCAGKRVDPKSAFDLMLNANLTPLKKYPGANVPWKCTCNKCKKVVTPTYSAIRIGQGGCRYCTNKGLQYNDPAYIYLMTHSEFHAHKIGVANQKTRNNRVLEHQKSGWKIFKTIDFIDGDSAFQVEQKVLLWLRKKMGIGVYLNQEQMPQGGYTETVDASEIDLVTIWAKVEQLSRKQRSKENI